ncbi:phosphatidylglycerol lysyltransferase domain-containing protein [Aureimonas sp. AU40]|uniref:phosphatidylglycerol lysyltransferase domain-containing protein n=1 Tax=Aureimonas sp. AU40 TaxID=1637747 RepID=UPI000782F2B1|nr:phosphatidylglycerol lysyltransferase domain-containing protein [Aureimonas sp. AU40]
MPSLKSLLDSWLESRLPDVPPFEPDLATRLRLCRDHGDFSLAYSTAVQPGLRYFGDEKGYIAFATKMGHAFVLGDPVTGEGERDGYIRRFVAQTRHPCFVQIGHATAGVLAGLGYHINQIGIESELPLEAHSFAGKRYETIRYSETWLRKKGYRILECDGSVVDAEQIRHISSNWRTGRIVSRREMRFLNRPFEPFLAPPMRRFMLLHPDGQATAILDFDPIFKDGDVVGYTAAFKRKLVGTTAHAEIGLTKFAADRFREEGRLHLSFGLSPLAGIKASAFPESRLWRLSFEQAFRSKRINEKIFNLQGQAAFKRRFHGNQKASYIAFKRGSPVEMLALLRLLKTL